MARRSILSQLFRQSGGYVVEISFVLFVSRNARHGYNEACLPHSEEISQQICPPAVHLSLPSHPEECQFGCHTGKKLT